MIKIKFIEKIRTYKYYNLETILLLFSLFINFACLNNDVFSGDSSMYASISKSLAESNNYYELKTINNGDWLDKPHFPFWIWTIFIKLFGANTCSFKLPGLIFFLISLRYTYLFAEKHYNKKIAFNSILILSTALHTFISNNDLRAEVFIMGLLIASVYYYDKLIEHNNLQNQFLSALLTAFVIMTKGIFIFIIIIVTIFGSLLLKKDLKNIFESKWLLNFILIFIFIIPELYCLYLQFHNVPKITINNHENINYLKFFFWDSQFGRFLNTGPIKGEGNILFFFHTILWAFYPWTILILLIKKISIKEFYTLIGFLFTFLIFSFSKFQLSHYINIVFPFLSIIIANILSYDLTNIYSKKIVNIHKILLIITFIFMNVFVFYFDKINLNSCLLLFFSFLIFKSFYSLNQFSINNKLIYITTLVGLLLGFFLNVFFYPKLLSYQLGKKESNFVDKIVPDSFISIYGFNPHLFHYYSNKKILFIHSISDINDKQKNNSYFIINNLIVKELIQNKIKFLVLKKFNNFHITRLNSKFLNKNSRENQIEKLYLIKTL